MADRQTLIIGGGIAGLTAAYELSRAGRRVTLLERRPVLGGLARSQVIAGRETEVYYHFICADDHSLLGLIDELGLTPHLRWAEAPTSYFVDGRLYPFTTPADILRFSPVPFGDRLRFGLFATQCRRRTQWRDLDGLTAEAWLRRSGGERGYEVLWRPLLEGKFGRYAGQVSAPWIWHRLHRASRSRRSLLRPERFGCLAEGTSLLLRTLAERIREAGGEILTGEAATGLVLREGRVAAVRTSEGEREAELVVAAAPLPELAQLLPPEAGAYRRELEAVDFLGVRCLLLRLTERLTDSYWVNVNDARCPFPGLIEYSHLNAEAAAALGAMVYVPLYMATDDPRWPQEAAALTETLLAGLRVLRPELRPAAEAEAALVTGDEYAQAITPPGFGGRLPDLRTPVEGLWLLDSTQLYPSDRCLSGMIGLARELARRCRL